jgi:hypothetical protein
LLEKDYNPDLSLEDYGRGQAPPLRINVVARFILASSSEKEYEVK